MPTFYEKGKKYNCYVKGIPYFRKTITIEGKRHQVYGDGEKDANRKLEELKELHSSGIELSTRNSKVGDIFEYWMYDIKRLDSAVKASTFSGYESIYRNHIKPYKTVMNLQVSKLSNSALQKYINTLYNTEGCSPTLLTSVLKVWRIFSKWLIDNDYISKNPTRNITIPGTKERNKEIEVFTDEERKKILSYIDESQYMHRALIKVAFATGMRVGELLALRWEDISDHAIHVKRSYSVHSAIDDDGNRTLAKEVWDTKTKNSVRTIPLLKSTERILTEHKKEQKALFRELRRKPTGYVFTNSNGALISPGDLRLSYMGMLNRAGVPYKKFHTIRHTFATEAIRRGVDVKDLQKLMGHSDLQTTYIYVQSDDESRRNAIERMGDMM